MSDELKNYYVFEYVYDPVAEGFTTIEGELQGYIQAGDPFEACQKLGFDDPNRYFSRPIENMEKHENALKDEIEKMKKLQKQLQPMIDEFKREMRKCPNCGADLDEKFNCPSCHFGHERELAEKEAKKERAAKKSVKKAVKKKV